MFQAVGLDPLSPLDYRLVIFLRTATATAGSVLLAWDAWARGRPGDRLGRQREAILGVLAVVAIAGYFAFGQFHRPAFVNYYDFLHQYVGAKYFPELGYGRLYGCVSVADVEDGFAGRAARRWVRDLSTNEAWWGHPAIHEPGWCTRHFTPQRWQEFRHDVSWLRARIPPAVWDSAMMSHGYNGTPVGTVVLHSLANLGPASDRRILSLALLDPLLLAGMWGLVLRTFGWRVTAVAILWWGTNQPAGWTWHGGSFLRQLHLVTLVTAICLARRGLPGWAGSLLGGATALRVFPLVALVGPLLQILGRARTSSDWEWRHSLRLTGGLVASLSILVALSLFVPSANPTRGAAAWSEFIEDTRVFSQTPLTNSVGLRALLSFEERTRAVHVQALWERYPWDTWRAGRARAFAQRRWMFGLAILASLLLVAWAVRRCDTWVALTVGSGLIPVVLGIPGYYYGFLLVFAFLWTRHPWLGVGLLAVSVVSNLALALFDARDDLYLLVSASVVLYVTLATFVVGGRRV